MNNIIVTGHGRAEAADVDELAGFGVATLHEAMGRTGLAGPHLRPIQQGAAVAGTAVTVLTGPGDNLMIHAAVEQCRPGDLLVVATTADSADGMFGELLATALQRRGVRGLVTASGVRDTAAIREMGFPVWAAAVNAQGTTKANAGSVNVAVEIGDIAVRAGDVVVADDDGVLCVPRSQVAETIVSARARVLREEESRAAFAAGELGLDRYGLRDVLDRLGVTYVQAGNYDG